MKIRQNLKKNRRILHCLTELRRPHKRGRYCQKPPQQQPKWWLRKMKKREQKRLERQQKAWAKFQRFGKKKKLTQKELKLQQRRDFLVELYKTIKGKIPGFRMKYRMVNIAGPLPHETNMRRHVKKRRMLAILKKEHSVLCSELGFLMSSSVAASSTKLVWNINKLTREKMFWDHVFNDVQALYKLLTKKIAENGTYLEKLHVKMTQTYFKRKEKDKYLVTQPAYFDEVEYHLYPEKRMHTRKSLKQRYLEDLAEIEQLLLTLSKEREQVQHYLITRELFVSVLNKILNKLNKGKAVVLDLLQDGHNVMNDLTIRMFDLLRMKKITKKSSKELEEREKQAMNEKAILWTKAKGLMARHRPYKSADMWVDLSKVLAEPTKTVEELKEGLRKEYEIFQKAILVMGGYLNRGNFEISVYTKLSQRWWIPEVKETAISNSFLMSKIAFPLIEAKSYTDRVGKAMKLIPEKKQIRVDIKNRVIEQQKRLKPVLYAARKAGFKVRRRFMTMFKKWKCFMKPLRDFYDLLNKKSTYQANKLGIHNKVVQFNKMECLKALQDSVPYYVAKLIYLEKYSKPTVLPYNTIIRETNVNRFKWKRYQQMKSLIYPQTEHLKKQKNFVIRKHPPLHKSPCPLCCVQERLSKMAIVEQFEDHIRTVYEIQCELRDTQHFKDLQDLNHPIWECKQPAARFLIQLLILEDRTRAPGKIMDFTKITK